MFTWFSKIKTMNEVYWECVCDLTHFYFFLYVLSIFWLKIFSFFLFIRFGLFFTSFWICKYLYLRSTYSSLSHPNGNIQYVVFCTWPFFFIRVSWRTPQSSLWRSALWIWQFSVWLYYRVYLIRSLLMDIWVISSALLLLVL